MEGVPELRQIDDTHTHWRTKVAGREKEFDAVVTEQRPDERIAWTSKDGPEHARVVERRVKGDLERFKELIESRGVQSAGWRGEVTPQ
jgi:uncharacterized membrane protein